MAKHEDLSRSPISPETGAISEWPLELRTFKDLVANLRALTRGSRTSGTYTLDRLAAERDFIIPAELTPSRPAGERFDYPAQPGPLPYKYTFTSYNTLGRQISKAHYGAYALVGTISYRGGYGMNRFNIAVDLLDSNRPNGFNATASGELLLQGGGTAEGLRQEAVTIGVDEIFTHYAKQGGGDFIIDLTQESGVLMNQALIELQNLRQLP